MPDAFVHEEGDLADVVLVVGQHGCHVLGRVVGFEVGGLVGDDRVRG